jgi:hypothetical protein
VQQHDISKLPVWAQNALIGQEAKISDLTRQLAEARGEFPEDSAVWIGPYQQEHPVGNPKVEFRAAGAKLTAEFDPGTGTLTVHTVNGGLVIRPVVSNSVRLCLERY